MRSFTLADLQYITSSDLATQVKSNNPDLAVIDVRDSDYIGGHIIRCQNVPTQTHDYRMPELVRTLKDKKVVVFHCALSQQRGPSSALRYLRERERFLGSGESVTEGKEDDSSSSQKVYVLDGGFTKWQESYGEDKQLTEGYDKELWQFGY